MNKDGSIYFLNSMLDNSHDMVFVIRIHDLYIEYVNKTAIEKFGYSKEEMNEIGIDAFRRPFKDNETFIAHLQELEDKDEATDYAYIIRKDGTEFPVEVNAKFVHKDGVDYNMAIVRDITKRVESEKKIDALNKNLELLVVKKTEELQHSLAFFKSYRRAIDASSIVSKSDINGLITYVNEKFCEVTGYNKEEVIGRPHSIVRDPSTDSAVFKELWHVIQAKGTWKGILKNRKKDGTNYWVDIIIMPIVDDNGEISEYIAIRHDITELIEQRETLEKITITDPLTGLYNRYKLMQDIEAVENPSIAILDLQRFGQINDLYGEAFGDKILQELATSMIKLFKGRLINQPYHLQADVFAILNVSLQKDAFVNNIMELIEKIENTIYRVDGKEIMLQMTSGLSFEKNNLFITADMALSNAKKNRINLLVYDKEHNLDSQYENNLKYINVIRNAIEKDTLTPFYQAIVNNKTGKWEKYESLVRIIGEDQKVITPFFFLEIAKLTKYYETLTKIVIQKSFDTFRYSDKEFSINLTVKDIMNVNIQEFICHLLESYNIGERVVFEIVESDSIDNFDEVIVFINKTKFHGCKIAIDDFGTGYANFNYLLKLRADYIKIDGSLIKDLETDEDAKILVKTIVNFAKELNILTIAEYVENKRVYEIVTEIGVDYSQGYYFSEPTASPSFDR